MKIKGKLVFNFLYDKFGFDGDFYVRNLDSTLESASTSRQNGTLSLFLV